MSNITEKWVGKKMYRTRPKFMDKSTSSHPFDYSYCIYGYYCRSEPKDECIEFVGFTQSKQIVTKSKHSDALWTLESEWNDGFWEIYEDGEKDEK